MTTGKVGCENMALIPVVGETDGDESGEDRDKPLLIRERLSLLLRVLGCEKKVFLGAEDGAWRGGRIKGEFTS